MPVRLAARGRGGRSGEPLEEEDATAETGIPNVVELEGRGAVEGQGALSHLGLPPRDACIPKGSTRGKGMGETRWWRCEMWGAASSL